MKLPNITYQGDLSKLVSADDDYYGSISYFKTIDDFMDYQSYSKFINEVEKLVRTSDDYKTYINYIKKTLGVNFCQVFSNVYDDIDATIELHHGPLFTLYDICEIILNWFIKSGQRINTFRVANKVLDEHFQLRVGCVMLSKTMHESAHNNELFLNINQCIGNVDAFIKIYSAYLTDEQKYKIWNYMAMCENNKSFDRGILDLDYIAKHIKAC